MSRKGRIEEQSIGGKVVMVYGGWRGVVGELELLALGWQTAASKPAEAAIAVAWLSSIATPSSQ